LSIAVNFTKLKTPPLKILSIALNSAKLKPFY